MGRARRQGVGKRPIFDHVLRVCERPLTYSVAALIDRGSSLHPRASAVPWMTHPIPPRCIPFRPARGLMNEIARRKRQRRISYDCRPNHGTRWGLCKRCVVKPSVGGDTSLSFVTSEISQPPSSLRLARSARQWSV